MFLDVPEDALNEENVNEDKEDADKRISSMIQNCLKRYARTL